MLGADRLEELGVGRGRLARQCYRVVVREALIWILIDVGHGGCFLLGALLRLGHQQPVQPGCL